MIEFLGMAVWALANAWCTLLVFFGTVPTFGEALFSGDSKERVLGVLLWLGIIYFWYSFFASFEIRLV